METKDLVILVLSLGLAGFSLYRKYIAKNKPGSTDSPKIKNTAIPGKDDDYEPYSGR